MNRFTRNNLLLISVIAVSCVMAVGLFIFSIIRVVSMNQCIANIKTIKKQIEDLGRKNPSPHKNNEKPLEYNKALYAKTSAQLELYFRPRMQAVAEKFVKMLQERNPRKEDGKVVPLTVEQFRRDYEEMWNKGQNYVDKQYNYKNFCELRFTNWNQVVRKLLPEARALTTEPVNEETLPEMLFSFIGIPRVMGEQPANMLRFLKEYQSALVKMISSVKFDMNTERVDWFGFKPDPTIADIASIYNNPKEHYPRVAKVWEIYGDVLKRMAGCTRKVAYTEKGKKIVANSSVDLINRLKDHNIPYTEFDDNVDKFLGLALRGSLKPQSSNDNSNLDNFRNAFAGNEEGPFRVYRMRITVSGSMAGLRTFIRSLDEAYKDNRVYVVRSIGFESNRDGADAIFRSREEQASGIAPGAQQNAAAPQAAGRGRGRGRGMSAPAVQAPAPVSAKEAAFLEERKKAIEEANKKLKFFERIGYGDVLIGDDNTFTAVVDFDYYELKYEAN